MQTKKLLNNDFLIVDEMKDEYLKELFTENPVIYVRPGIYAMSTRKIESLKKIAEAQKFYQRNPVRFIDHFFHIDLIDAQAYIVQRSWNCPNVLLVCTRGLGKSTITDLIIMAKGMLFNNHWSYIASGSGSQAEQTFTTLEKIANDNIEQMKGSTGYIFKDEIEINHSAGDGFSHSSNGFSYRLHNGAKTLTLNSNVDKKRGFRGNFVVFDECGFLDADMMQVYAAFCIIDQDFGTGKDENGNPIDITRLRCIPSQIPNQLFYISSASSTDTEFYRKYRDFSKRMLMGDLNYFVAHIDCDIALNPTIHGKPTRPMFQRDLVESAMRTNPEKARREYYCEFTTDAGTSAIIRRAWITRNEVSRKPLLYNDTGDKKFIIAYDPARSRDNSVILVCEVYTDTDDNGNSEAKMRIVNCINLMDVGKKIKSPMQTPDQIEYLKKVILDYNAGADAYGNILGIYIDAGSGGSGVNIADFLMQNWTDKSGTVHRGLIDKTYSAEYVNKFPEAVDKVRLMSPTAFKSEMFECMIELISQNKVEFTAQYDNKGSLTVFDVDKKMLEIEKAKISEKLSKENFSKEELEEKIEEEIKNIPAVKTRVEKLDWLDEIALAGIDALKEELVNIVRKKRDSGKDSFDLTPEKTNRLNDDRAYTAAMACYALMCERRKEITQRRRPPNIGLVDKLRIRKANVSSILD